jgi:inosine-uridine nucleoside N-ribohydrolase
MKKTLPLLAAVVLLAASLGAAPVAAQEATDTSPQKVILDTDMVELFDDGMAMLLLDRAPNIDLLGVTDVAGNTPVGTGVAMGVRQLEALGSSTPIYEGSRYGIRFWRASNPDALAAEELFSPVVGWAGYLKPYMPGLAGDPLAEWDDVYQELYGEAPTYPYVYGPGNPDPDGNDEAVEFLVDTVREYPGEVTIVAIGPLTNIARAIMADPMFSRNVKQIAYMGGSFFLPGNSSASAEFNWWADPDAAKICVRSQWGDPDSESYQLWGNQMIDGLEANWNTGPMPEDLYPRLVADTFPGIRELFLKREAEIEAGGWGTIVPDNIWDLFAAAWVIDPSIVLSWNDAPRPEDGVPQPMSGVYVDVNSEYGIDYGKSTAFTADQGPVATQKAAIQSFIDEQRFWYDLVHPLATDEGR